MKRAHLLSTALGLAMLAAPAAAAAQREAPGRDRAAVAQGRAADEGGPAGLVRRAQTALRAGRTAQASDLLERAETRLLSGDGGARPAAGEPARHVSEARRALANRNRAEAMRHSNLAVAALGGSASASGADSATGRPPSMGGGRGGNAMGGPGLVDTGMGTVPGPGSTAVVRDGGTGSTSISRAEGAVLAQSGGGRGGGSSALPPGDTIPGWSGPRSGAAAPDNRGGFGAAPQGPPLGAAPSGAPINPAPGVPSGVTTRPTPGFGSPGLSSGPGSAGATGGEPARVGGAPPGDTSRSPGSSGIGGSGAGIGGMR